MKIIITKEIMAKKVENFRTCGYWYALENVFFMILGGYYYSSLPILINYLLLQGLDKDQEQSVLSEVFNSVLHKDILQRALQLFLLHPAKLHYQSTLPPGQAALTMEQTG